MANFPLYQTYLITERGLALLCCSSHKKCSSSLKCKKLKELRNTVNITNSIPCCLSKFIFQKRAVCCLEVADGCEAQWGFIAAINSVVAAGVNPWGQWLGHEITLRYFVMTCVCRSCMCWSQYHYWIFPNERHLFWKFKQNISSTEHDPFRNLCNTSAPLMNPSNSSKSPIFGGKSVMWKLEGNQSLFDLVWCSWCMEETRESPAPPGSGGFCPVSAEWNDIGLINCDNVFKRQIPQYIEASWEQG